MNFEEALVMFSLSAGISLVSSSGTGSQAGSMGMVAPPGNQLSTGSGAFISAPELWMVLIFHDELPQPNEREWERDEGEQEEQESAIENPGGILFAFAPLGLERVGGVLCVFSGKRSASLHTHASLSSQMKSQRRSFFSLVHPWCCSWTAHLLLIKQWQKLSVLLLWNQNEITCTFSESCFYFCPLRVGVAVWTNKVQPNVFAFSVVVVSGIRRRNRQIHFRRQPSGPPPRTTLVRTEN